MKKTITTTLMALLLCVCMVFGLTACGGFTQDDIDNAVNDATATLNEQITALEADIADKTAKIATLEGEKTALTTEKGELEADIQEIEAEVTALETEKATLEAEVAALEEEKASLITDKATLEASITAKNNEIANLNSSISALNTEKANLTARVTEFEASIAAKDTEIADLNSSITTLQSEKANLESQITELQDKNDELEKENETLTDCLAGKHVIDTENEISYTWSDDYSTCTAMGLCVHCDNEAIQTANGVEGEEKITATFEDSDLGTQVVHTVTTYEKLNDLLQSGETVTIRLDATLENIQDLYCDRATTAVLDMNGNDIIFQSGYSFCVLNCSLTLTGVGTVSARDTATMNCHGRLFIEEDVTVNGGWYAFLIEGRDYDEVTIIVSGGTINAKADGRNFYFLNEYANVKVTGGTFSCDPSEHVDQQKYTVTENENGTWTVDCNHKESTHTTVYDFGDGSHGFVCTDCDRVCIEKHSSIYDDKGNGTHIFTCTVCGIIDIEKHSYDENEECVCGVKLPVVTTSEELLEAVANGGKIRLGADIELTSILMVVSDVSIDLNGKTLSNPGNGVMYIYNGCTASISNGEIVSAGTALMNYGTLSVDNCTVTDVAIALDNSDGITTVTNSTLNGLVEAFGGTITLYDSVILGAGTGDSDHIGLESYGGTIVCYFDPSDMLYTAYGQSVVTNNGDGTWTVTEE